MGISASAQTSTTTTQNVNVGRYFNYSCTMMNPYSVVGMDITKTKHPGVPHESLVETTSPRRAEYQGPGQMSQDAKETIL